MYSPAPFDKPGKKHILGKETHDVRGKANTMRQMPHHRFKVAQDVRGTAGRRAMLPVRHGHLDPGGGLGPGVRVLLPKFPCPGGGATGGQG